MPPAKAQFRVGVDVGGTFTDIVVFLDSDRIYAKKVPSTPDDYSRAILDGLISILREFQLDPGAATDVVHGATVATNAILLRKGANTGLITTPGFRDVLEIGRLRRPVLYDMFYEKTETAGRAVAKAGGHRAHGRGWERGHAFGRGRSRRRPGQAGGQGSRIGRCGFHQFVREPGARTCGRRDRQAVRTQVVRVPLRRRRPGDKGVRTDEHGGD